MARSDRHHRTLLVIAALAAAVTGVLGTTVAGQPAVAAVASGDPVAGVDCSVGRVMSVIAHPDDDLLFQGTDLQRDLVAGRCVRTVVVTAADAGYPMWYWRERQVGLMAAYANILGVDPASTTTTITVAGKQVQLDTLTAAPRVSLVFLDLPDGNLEGNGFWATGYTSLQQLYQGYIPTLSTVADAPDPAQYTLPQLRSVLSGLLDEYSPTDVHTLDYSGRYGDGDHSDHHTVAYLTDQAQQQYAGAHGFTGYLGYPIADRPTNLTSAQVAAKSAAFFTYAAHDDQTCTTWEACAPRPESSWLTRQYTVGQADPAQPTDPSVPGGTRTDVTGSATVTASAENPADGQTAAKAVDGVVSGYPANPSAEWVAPNGRAGTWIQLGWSTAKTLSSVDLADRPNSADQVTGGTLTFSDGSSVTVPALANAGTPQQISFTPRSVTWVRFTVTSVSSSTQNVGLAEIRAYTSDSATTPTTSDLTGSATVTASAENPSDGQTAAKAVDGVVSGYPANPSAEWVAPNGRAGTWIQLTWTGARTVTEVDLADRPNTDDQVTGGTLTFSDGSSVTVPALPNGGTVQPVTFAARSVTWVRFTVTSVSASTQNIGLAELRALGTTSTATPTPTPMPTPTPTLRDVTASATPTASADNPADGQTVGKAVDGVVSGYPTNASAEWVAPNGRAGTWIQLTFPSAVALQRIELHDRPNSVDQVTAGTLTFSDGTSVTVGSLPNAGTTKNVDFTKRTVTWVRFTVTRVSSGTVNAGLSEVRAWAIS